MTRDERQLIRMMNKSFDKGKVNSMNIEIKDLTNIQDESELKSEFDNLSADDTIMVKDNPTDKLNAYNLDPDYEITMKENDNEWKKVKSLSGDEMKNFIHTIVKKALTELGLDAELSIDLYASSDIGEDFDSWDEETDEVFDEYKPLIQHFVLENPWLPYEKDLRLNKFVIHQNNSVDLEFDIIFNRPPHLRNEPSDLNDPLNVLRRFYSLMGKSDVDGNNIKCSISYTDAPDDALQKGLTLYSISGAITSMEILQNYGLGLRIKVKGEIIIRDENRR